jgi:hypothetical protein
VILNKTISTPNFNFGIWSFSTGEKQYFSMSNGDDFFQFAYVLENQQLLCSPTDLNSKLPSKILNSGINDLSEYYKVPIEIKNLNFGTDMDKGTAWIFFSPLPMSDRYTLSELFETDTVEGDNTSKYIFVATGKVLANDKLLMPGQWSEIKSGKQVNLNLNPNSKLFLVEKK